MPSIKKRIIFVADNKLLKLLEKAKQIDQRSMGSICRKAIFDYCNLIVSNKNAQK